MCILFDFSDLNEASLLWNLKIRYEKELIYVSITFIIFILRCECANLCPLNKIYAENYYAAR